MLVSKMQN